MRILLIAFVLSHTLCGNFDADDLHASFLADYNTFNKKPSVAFEWYKKHLAGKNVPGYRYRGLLHLLSQTNNAQQIISLMPVVEGAFADDIDMQLLFIRALQQVGLQEQADARVIELISRVFDHQELAVQAVQAYMRRREPENALKTIDDYLAHASGRLNNFLFYFLRATIYLTLDKKNEAVAAIKKCVELQPEFDRAWLLYAVLHEQSGDLKRAIKGYRMFLEMSPQSIPLVREHLFRLYKKQKQA